MLVHVNWNEFTWNKSTWKTKKGGSWESFPYIFLITLQSSKKLRILEDSSANINLILIKNYSQSDKIYNNKNLQYLSLQLINQLQV